MRKNIITVLLSLFIGIQYAAAQGGEFFKVDGNMFMLLDEEDEVAYSTDFAKPDKTGRLEIPATVKYKGTVYTVTTITAKSKYAPWKYHQKDVKTVVLPNTITEIGDYAFYNDNSLNGHGFQKLRYINFPSSLKKIGSHAFRFTPLMRVELPPSVQSVGARAFAGCRLLEEIVLPNSVIQLGEDFASDCDKLTSITVPDSKPEIVRCNDSFNSLASYPRSGHFNFSGEALTTIRGNSSTLCPAYVVQDILETTGTVYGPEAGYFPIDPYQSSPFAKNYLATLKEGLNNNEPIATVAPNNNSSVSTTPVDRSIDIDIPAGNVKSNNTFAVIIGNENYQRIARVPYAANDATVFSAYCQKTLGLPPQNIRSYKDATFGTMLAALKDLQNIATAYNGDINVIFYYAGHGVPSETDRSAYLLPVDADGSQTEVCLSTKRLYDTLNGLGARKVVVLMDACFSGAQRGDGMLAVARGVALKVKEDAPKGNMVVFTAATGDQTAYPYVEKGHGLFTYFLIKKLQDTKGDVTLGDLVDYVSEQVARQSVVVNKHSQTPTVIPATELSGSWRNLKLQ